MEGGLLNIDHGTLKSNLLQRLTVPEGELRQCKDKALSKDCLAQAATLLEDFFGHGGDRGRQYDLFDGGTSKGLVANRLQTCRQLDVLQIGTTTEGLLANVLDML